ncbi:hypothetical protein MJO29_010549 [Puccinia striiformis f. sp. tritici]|nr:hypothetical protein MJO29_010549 [Puccinia striiformis f. sp. tritici]
MRRRPSTSSSGATVCIMSTLASSECVQRHTSLYWQAQFVAVEGWSGGMAGWLVGRLVFLAGAGTLQSACKTSYTLVDEEYKNSTKATRAPKSVSPPSGLPDADYDTLLGISYFDLNKESKRSKGMSKLASKKSESTTPLISADNSSGSSSPREPERSFVLVGVIGLPRIDLSDWYIVEDTL